MKSKSTKYIAIFAATVIILITSFQIYWLYDIYSDLRDNLELEIKEAMRSADFEELNRRINRMREARVGGKMDISLGSKNDLDNIAMKNEYTPEGEEPNEDTADESAAPGKGANYGMTELGGMLRTKENVIQVGLFLQKGIHTGIDPMMPVDVEYYASVLNQKLDSLGVHGDRSIVLLKKNPEISGFDTLKSYGNEPSGEFDAFSMDLDVNDSLKYELRLEKSLLYVTSRMKSALAFSLFTLIVLISAFWYTLRTIRKKDMIDEMRNDFTNNMTHELKTPIAVASAATDALLNFSKTPNPEKEKKYLTICKEQLGVLSELVERILSLSTEGKRSLKLVLETIEVKPLIEKAIENYLVKAGSSISIIAEIPDDFTVFADRRHFNNIVSNLIDNAIKYSDGAAVINVSAVEKDNGSKHITVTDNGIGIAKEKQKFIFDKFYRVSHGDLHDIKGYGLGLYYVKMMMTRFGGDVSVKSDLGKGSAFKLSFRE